MNATDADTLQSRIDDGKALRAEVATLEARIAALDVGAVDDDLDAIAGSIVQVVAAQALHNGWLFNRWHRQLVLAGIAYARREAARLHDKG